MNTVFQGVSETLHRFFNAALTPLGTSAVCLPDGTSLFVQPSSPADIATLPQAASLCHRYLKLADGDVAVANDPYSGGTTLSDFTLVLGVKLKGGAAPEVDLLLARRISLAPRLPLTGKLDDEGVRVPPTPLGNIESLNRDLLLAIASHPTAPRGLFESVTRAIEQLAAAAELLRRVGRDPGSILSSTNFTRYLDDSSAAFDALMSHLPLGTSIATRQLSSGETLKLQLKITESRVHFDFAGSESSGKIGLTELATFGACWAATVAASGESVPLNAGSFQHLLVSAPLKTILSSTPPTGTYRGMTEGIAAVARLSFDAIAMHKANIRAAQSAETNGCFQFVFDDGRIVSLQVPPGAGANLRHAGIDANSTWVPLDDFAMSPETLERDFPLTMLSAGVRANSGGQGKFRGGHGSVVSFQLLAAGELRWQDAMLGRKHDGLESGRAGIPGAIEIVRASSPNRREEITTASGSIRLSLGDQVYLLSAGGGGSGEPKSQDEPTG